ncbi:MAG: hypothetical protein ACXVCK_21950, partial [Bdellovibrionota bacterium]
MSAFLRQNRLLCLLALAYLVITVAAARPSLHDESEAYYHYGKNFLATGTYGLEKGRSDNFREPGYGLFLAAVTAPAQLFSPSLEPELRWIVFVQAALFVASILFFLWASELPEKVKFYFALLALLSPTLWGAHSDIYSETITIDIAVILITLLSRADFFRWRSLVSAAFLCGWLALTKLYLMYFFPLVLLAPIVAVLRGRPGLWRALVVPGFALLCLFGWSWRGHHVDRPEAADHRTILQLAGKVYRHRLWNLREEWKPALLASCCLNTCAQKYGAPVCNKFSWTVSDGVGYALMQDFADHPERHEKNLLHEVLGYWWSTLPMQIVSSGLELLRMAFFEAAPVWPDSPGAWKLFAQLWHVFGSFLLWLLVLAGISRLRDPGARRAGLVAGAVIAYHFLFMAQVTNVQRYTEPVIPFLYFFAALGLTKSWF